MRKITFLAGIGAGYVLGAKAGHERYAKIQEIAKKTADSPQVHQAMETAAKTAEKVADKAGIGSLMGGGKDASTTGKSETPTPASASNGYAATGPRSSI